jgi:hypothetical protein
MIPIESFDSVVERQLLDDIEREVFRIDLYGKVGVVLRKETARPTKASV